MSKTSRRKFSSEEKVKILRLHLLKGKAVSDICDEHNIHPNQFYRWQKTFFENGFKAFESQSNGLNRKTEKRINYLEKKLSNKDEVISELLTDHLQLKKKLGMD